MAHLSQPRLGQCSEGSPLVGTVGTGLGGVGSSAATSVLLRGAWGGGALVMGRLHLCRKRVLWEISVSSS